MAAPALPIVALEHPARAQVAPAQIQGRITNEDNGKPLAGVTVVVSGPSLQGEQTEFTDQDGHYLITQIPIGDNYVVRFYFNDVVVERPGIRLTAGTTLTINTALPTFKKKDVIVIKERAPSVDTASATVGQELNQEILQNTAVRGRTFEDLLQLAPGAVDPPRGQGGDVGVTFSGSSGNENNYLIDGLNTTDPNLGLISTKLHPYFIKELNIITGGYQAEYGRATGGVVSIVTKTGSNEFHGSIFGSWEPWQATATPVARLGEALQVQTTRDQRYDFGFELGGPIVKDRVWFYIGFAPTFTNTGTDRTVRTQTWDPDANNGAGGAAVNTNYQCPSYLSNASIPAGTLNPLCLGGTSLANTTTVQSGTALHLVQYDRQYNWLAKLQVNLSPDHNIQLGYIGAPDTFNGYGGVLEVNLPGQQYSQVTQIHDFTARYIGKLLDRKLQIEVLYGFHYQGVTQTPAEPNASEIIYNAPGNAPYSLSDFESWNVCNRQQVVGANGTKSVFNPCPITQYFGGGFGGYSPTQTLQRHVLMASATYYLRLLGSHAWKLGFDFEDDLEDHTVAYTGPDFQQGNNITGHYIYNTDPTGTQLQIYRANIQGFSPNDYGVPGVPCGPPNQSNIYCYNSFRAQTQERNYAVYLRDQWNVGFIPGLTLNLGVRWEGQEIYGVDISSIEMTTFNEIYGGNKPLSIYNNWAPRFGAVYDFTRKGRSKIYVNYGRFYESIPMDIADREFSGMGLLVGTGYTNTCATKNLQPGGLPVPVPASGPGTPCNLQGTTFGSAGNYGLVAPNLNGQYINEVVAGIQFDVGYDIVLGAGYIYRNFGNIIEDISVDGGQSYFVTNPGVPVDMGTVNNLQSQVTAANAAAAANPNNAQLASEATFLTQKLNTYKAGSLLPPAVRQYNALQLTANKRLSNRFSLLANYTYSRLIGNYPGTFSSLNGQNDPNISTQYDLIDLLINRYGPLPNDRPHNVKVSGFYTQPVGGKGTFIAGMTFSGWSGRPIYVLGYHPIYGPSEAYVLPAGAGGRTPFVWQFDLHLGYEHQLTKAIRMHVGWDIINIFDQQAVVNVDDNYTYSPVLPILNGTLADLRHLKTYDGSPLVPNSNYGNATGYQEPLYMRFSARLAF